MPGDNGQYLVMVRHSMDDIPIGIGCCQRDVDAIIARWKTRHRAALEIIGSDASTPVYIAVYSFETGVLVSMENVRELY